MYVGSLCYCVTNNCYCVTNSSFLKAMQQFEMISFCNLVGSGSWNTRDCGFTLFVSQEMFDAHPSPAVSFFSKSVTAAL